MTTLMRSPITANHKEYMLCWKGMFLEFWYMTDPNGNPTELLKPLLDYDEATHDSSWLGRAEPSGRWRRTA